MATEMLACSRPVAPSGWRPTRRASAAPAWRHEARCSVADSPTIIHGEPKKTGAPGLRWRVLLGPRPQTGSPRRGLDQPGYTWVTAPPVTSETAAFRSTHQPALITAEYRVWAKAIAPFAATELGSPRAERRQTSRPPTTSRQDQMRSPAMRGFRAERYQASARARSRGAGKAGQDQRPCRVAKQASPARARALMRSSGAQ